MDFRNNTGGYGAALDAKLRSDALIRLEEKRIAAINSVKQFNMAKVDRLTNDWTAFVRSFNYDLRTGGAALIARGRELYQNDPYSKKIVTEKIKGIIGPEGPTLRNNAGEYQLVKRKKRRPEDADEFDYKFIKDRVANGIINEQFYDYAINNYITIEGDQTFVDNLDSLVTSVFVDGEVFIKKLPGPKYNPFGFTTQNITAEYCDWKLNKDLGNGRYIVMGIEVDEYWRKVAYWFKKGNPKQDVDWGYNWTQNYERVEADKIIHLYVKELTHQLRGVTLFAPVGIRLKMLYGFEEAALVRSRFTAKTPGIIQRIVNAIGPEGAGIGTTDKDSDGNWLVDVADGEFLKTKDGYEVKNLDSDYPHQLHGDFVKFIMRGVSAGADIGYSTISNNYESVTWHSGKLEKQSERDAFKKAFRWLKNNYLNVVFGGDMCWLDMAALAGKFKLPSGRLLPVVEKRAKFNRPQFFGRTWEYTNPKEERESNILALQTGEKTFEDLFAERGVDLDDRLDQMEEERNAFEARGLGDIWMMIMTKYNVTPAETSTEKDQKEAAGGNGNGKANKELMKELQK